VGSRFPVQPVCGTPQQPTLGVGCRHDHVRLRQHEIGPIVGIAVVIIAGHAEHTRTTEGGETVGGSSCGGELGPGGDSTEMINVGGPYAGNVRETASTRGAAMHIAARIAHLGF
jgi:hypothetical protein